MNEEKLYEVLNNQIQFSNDLMDLNIKYTEEIERLQHNQEVSTKWEIELTGRISKALEYIKTFCNDKARVRNDISGKDIDKLIKILKGSDKE